MKIMKMKVSEWIKVKDNPIQRDTERHAAKAKHLLTPLLVHSVCFAAELPDGKLVKLDGHTRALLWQRSQVRPPPEVIVNCIPVQDMKEVVALYQAFDTKEALETVTDKVSGAFGHHNFHPESGLLKKGSIANALRMCWNVRDGRAITGNGGEGRQAFNIYEAVEEFSNEIFALDSFELGAGNITSGVVAAFILTMRKHGNKVIPFWRSLFADAGEKKNGKMDGVQALNELRLQRKGNFGGSAIADMTCRSVMAVEKWLADEEFSSIPRPYDLKGYIDGSAAQFSLIKSGSKKAVSLVA